MRLCVALAFASACQFHDPVRITGEMSASRVSPQPDAVDVVVRYSPESGDHETVGVTVYGNFPTAFRLGVPGPPSSAFEDRPAHGSAYGFELASGAVWLAKPGTTIRDEGGEHPEMIQHAGYELLYLTADAGTQTPFNVAGLQHGWNMIRRVPLTCADEIWVDGRLTGWNFRYELLAVSTVMTIELGYDAWNPPYCP